MPAASTSLKFWNMAKSENGHADIYLEGDIVSEQPIDWWGDAIAGNYITPEGFREDLESIGDADDITIHINSCGGDVYTSIAIYNAIKSLNKDVTTVVDGVALSGGSVIAMAGKSIEMYPGSLMMIHPVSVSAFGMYNSADLKKIESAADAMDEAIATIYSNRTGKTVDECKELMNEETWMTGQKAVDNGFADKVIDGEVDIEFENKSKILFVNKVKIDAKNFKVPEGIKRIRNAPKKAKNAKNKGEKGEPKKMDLKELKDKYPDLVEEIRIEATNAERNRIREIDEIASNISDASAIAEAKYGENPSNAAALAFNYLKTAKNLGQQFVANLENGAENSGANGVTAMPKNNPEGMTQAQKDEAEGNQALNAVKEMFAR